jgi:hypothetical protein
MNNLSLITSIILALFTALPPTILALAALITSIHNGQKINDVHLSLNSRLSELLKASLAQGRQDERNDQRDGYSMHPNIGTGTTTTIPTGTTTTTGTSVSTFVPTITVDKS